jgi:hypothetical protein
MDCVLMVEDSNTETWLLVSNIVMCPVCASDSLLQEVWWVD